MSTYIVQPGDTLSSIARNKAVSLSSIMELNSSLENSNKIQVGQNLLLPKISEPRDQSCPDEIMGESPCVEIEGVEPGFHIIERPQTIDELKNHLFAGIDDGGKSAMLHRLNPWLENGVRPGQVIVLSDPRSMQCTQEESLLMQVSQEVNIKNSELNHEEAQMTVDYYNLLGAATGGAGVAIGNTATGIRQYTRQVESKLRQIEALYQHVYERTGRLGGEEFYARRRVLFGELDSLLDHVTSMGLGIPEHPNLRHALGLSTKSTVHHWRQAGSAASGIPGYADNYAGVTNASKWLGRAGYVGLGFSAISTQSNIRAACITGREEECNITRVREWGSFIGSAGGGAAGAAAVGPVAGAVCI